MTIHQPDEPDFRSYLESLKKMGGSQALHAQEVLEKSVEDEERDDHGRWTSGGGPSSNDEWTSGGSRDAQASVSLYTHQYTGPLFNTHVTAISSLGIGSMHDVSSNGRVQISREQAKGPGQFGIRVDGSLVSHAATAKDAVQQAFEKISGL